MNQRIFALIRSLRPFQWSKNLLIAVPALTAQVWMQPDVASLLVLAFVAFSLVASGGYVVNDMLDLEADRNHPEKKSRPFASGQLSAAWGYLLGPATMLVGIAMAFFAVSNQFGIVVVVYAALSVAYSRWIKRLMVLDVILLAGFYTLRLVAGGAAIDLAVSSWLLVFSLFFFLSLAFAKRLVEIMTTGATPNNASSARPYTSVDEDAFRSIGPASGMLSILVFALYISGDAVQAVYDQPQILWLVCPLLLYWILRVWFFALRGELHHDPVVFALRDKVSYLAAAAIMLVLYLAS